MINKSWCIDWISVTFKNTIVDTAAREALSFGMKPKDWSEGIPRWGYSIKIEHPFGHSIMFHPGRKEMGLHIQFTGRALKTLADGGIPALQMVRWCNKEQGSFSRLDLAIDCYDEIIDIPSLVQGKRVEKEPGNARSWRVVRGHDGGCTGYVGSRSSEKFLRVYDKAVETGQLERPWTRFELELKGDTAKAAGHDLNSMDEKDVGAYTAGLIKASFNPENEQFQRIMSAPSVHLPTKEKTDDTTLNWLLETVSKTVARTIARRTDVDVWTAFQSAVQMHMTSLGMGGDDISGSDL